MRNLIGLLILLASPFLMAGEKINFNELIRENNNSKQELIKNLYDQVHSTQANEAETAPKQAVTIADDSAAAESFIAPTTPSKPSKRRDRSAKYNQKKMNSKLEKEIISNELSN